MGKPSAPTPPNPKETGAAQTATNIGTAIAQSNLNNVNQVTPDGSLTYSQSGTYEYKDPLNGQIHKVPQYTATQTLSPQQQAIKNQNDAAALNLGKLANNQSGFLEGYLSQPVNTSGAPEAGNPGGISGPNFTRFGAAPQFSTTFGDAGDITRTYGDAGGYEASRKKVEDALFARLNPQIDRDRAALETQLANQGIARGSRAFSAAFNDFGRSVNDARLGTILSAGQEQNRLAALDSQKAGFENSAQAQAYEQALGRGTFALGAGQQNFQNQFQTTGANNQLAAQEFDANLARENAQSAARKDYLNEQFATRNQPINEITALLSGSQVSQPNFVNTPSTPIANTDYAGLVQDNYNAQLGLYNSKLASSNNLFGGLFGLGSALLGNPAIIKASDRRVKEDIKKVGEVEGHNIYKFRYKGGGPVQLGVIAQEVERKNPDAVTTIGGVKHVKYGEIFGLGA